MNSNELIKYIKRCKLSKSDFIKVQSEQEEQIKVMQELAYKDLLHSTAFDKALEKELSLKKKIILEIDEILNSGYFTNN